MNLICKIFGHSWEIINEEWSSCDRCHEVKHKKYEGPEPSVYYHDNVWDYKPKKKGGENK